MCSWARFVESLCLIHSTIEFQSIFVLINSKNDEGNSRSMGVAFRRIDQNNIEMQIYSVDANGDVGDFAEFSTEMKRAKEKKK